MYVCLCNAITDSEIRGAADLGAHTLADLSATLGVATCCRRCADCASGVLNDHLAAVHGAARAKAHGSVPAEPAEYSTQGAD